MKIGGLELKNKVILAPMAGVTDSSFRQLAVEMGAALVYTEMISAKGAVCAPKQTLKLAQFAPEERPIGIQLFGSELAYFAEAATLCATYMPDIVDINMGCPVKKVAGKGEGCALMRDPKKAYAITRAVCEAITLPVTVKMRKGWDEASVNAVEVAQAVEEAGAAVVTVHGRTRAHGYSGRADWSAIAAVKASVKIPVVGNGDIWVPQDAERMLLETGCDAVMIGRGSLGNPWLIKRTVHYLQTGELIAEPGPAERAAFARRHLALMVKEKGEYTGVREMRKHAAWYIKGIYGAASIRNRVMHAETVAEMNQLLVEVEQR